MTINPPTVEQFLTQTDLPEFDVEIFDSGDALESIAASMRQLVDVMTGGGGPVQLIADLEAEVTEIEALHDAKQALIDEVLAICKPSTSKLANSIRAVLEPVVAPPAAEPVAEPVDGVPAAVRCPACARYFADQELLDRHECTGPVMPAHDADVEEWRAYAGARGYAGTYDETGGMTVDQMNRSQIRTLLGIPQTSTPE